jgi:ABC-type branched-subunit amino acid transport system substrate-binding protein
VSLRRLFVASVSACCVAATGLVATAAPRVGAADEKPSATEIGVTPTELRIAVIADVDTPLAPGAYAGARDAVEGFAKYINGQGGLAGRKVVVDFYDSKLNPDETRNAIIKACQNDFAIVGTGALFMNNVDDLVGCPDKSGAKTGLPDVPVVTLWEAQQASPVSFPITAPSKVFSDPSGETYQSRVGRFRWYLQHVSKDLHGIFLVGADFEALKTASMPIWLGAQKVGVKSDGTFDVHATDGQDKYLPIATAIKSDGSTIVSSAVNDTSQAYMLKEAAVQGVNTVKVWDCTSACYSKRFLETAGAKAEGQYVDMPFVPVEEAKYSPAIKAYVKAVGDGIIDGNGELAWAASLFFRDAVNAAVKQGGVNALTRANWLTAAKGIHSFDADGMLATSDIPAKKATPCTSLFQVKGGKFVRVFPSKPASFDCNPKNVVLVKQSGS